MFEVTYTLKGISYDMSYKIEASTPEEARRQADGWVKVEAAGHAVKKVKVKQVTAGI